MTLDELISKIIHEHPEEAEFVVYGHEGLGDREVDCWSYNYPTHTLNVRLAPEPERVLLRIVNVPADVDFNWAKGQGESP